MQADRYVHRASSRHPASSRHIPSLEARYVSMLSRGSLEAISIHHLTIQALTSRTSRTSYLLLLPLLPVALTSCACMLCILLPLAHEVRL